MPLFFLKVNVKYEDLPVFLKVAEAMKIKGLHTEVSSPRHHNLPPPQKKVQIILKDHLNFAEKHGR